MKRSRKLSNDVSRQPAAKQAASTADASKQGTLVQVARLYYEENLSQQGIADQLGVSRPLINLYLKNARESGIVRIQIIDPTNACWDLEALLKEATGVKHIKVIRNPRGAQSLSLRALAGAAAEHIAECLSDGDTFGLAWGRTTAAVTEWLKPTRARNVDMVPLMGDSGHSVLHSQMNRLVMQAAEQLGARAHFISLPMVLSSADLRNALVKENGVREIISQWDRLDLVCIGIGVVPPVSGMVVYIGDDVLPRLIKEGAVGDLCGIYYDRNGRIIKSGLEDRIISASFGQLQAAGSLVAVACGDEKTLAVLGALRTGLVSRLFIDQSMAERIIAEIAAEKKDNT